MTMNQQRAFGMLLYPLPSLEVEIFPVVERSSSCGHANSQAFAFAPNFPVNTISADAY